MTDYLRFYGFSEDPFDIKPDPKFFFPAEGHGEALASMLYGINQKKGFVVILGDAGIGKTTLINHLLSTLNAGVKTILIPHSEIPFHEMLKQMLIALKLPPGSETKGSMIHELYYHLIQCLKQNETVAIIIDEAENISLDVIEEVRLLANLETSTAKLLQIVLVGELGLRDKLRSEVIRQIKQRVVINCQISPLTKDESLRYIDHRLKTAGSGSSQVFTEGALSLICRHANGIPLALNTLCHNALSVGYHRSEKIISPATVKKVQSQQEILSPEEARLVAAGFKRSLPRKIFYAASVLIIFAIAALFGGRYWQPFFDKFYAQQPTQPVAQPSIKDSSSDTIPATLPEVPGQDATGKISGNPQAEVMTVPSEAPQIPAPPPATSSRPPAEIRIREMIVVKQGTNLYSIAYQYYKNAGETFIDHILKVNPEITNPNLILIGQKIKIPEITESLLIVPTAERLFRVHLKTFTNKQNAEKFRRATAFIGIEREIVPWKVSPRDTWYRVTVGAFAAQEEGLKLIEEIRRKGFALSPG